MTVSTEVLLLTRVLWFYFLVITDASMLEKVENFLQQNILYCEGLH